MDTIPYTIKVRPDTGLYNAKMGIWLFLASEVMLFGALFSSYILLRVSNHAWPHGYELLNIPFATINTFLLMSSSISMIMAWGALKLNNFKKYRLYLGITILLALTFLCIKAFEYRAEFHENLFPRTNTFLALYFTMTGIHALHIFGGVLVHSYNWIFGRKMWETEPERFTNRIEIAGIYWHFVDLVWIFLFPVLYLS